MVEMCTIAPHTALSSCCCAKNNGADFEGADGQVLAAKTPELIMLLCEEQRCRS